MDGAGGRETAANHTRRDIMLWTTACAISDTVYQVDPSTVDEWTVPGFAERLYMRVDSRLSGGTYVFTYAAISMDMATGTAGLDPSSKFEDGFGELIPYAGGPWRS